MLPPNEKVRTLKPLAQGPQRPENMPFGMFSARPGRKAPEGAKPRRSLAALCDSNLKSIFYQATVLKPTFTRKQNDVNYVNFCKIMDEKP